MDVRCTIPIRTGRGLNDRLHWAAKAKRVEEEHRAVRLLFRQLARQVRLPALVELVRVSPGTRPMDDDNLPGALKAVRDAIAKELGVDDGRRDVLRFTYDQERGPWGVRITVRSMPACGPGCDDPTCRSHWRKP